MKFRGIHPQPPSARWLPPKHRYFFGSAVRTYRNGANRQTPVCVWFCCGCATGPHFRALCQMHLRRYYS